jgi:glycosyltransferase involved in cell wall biosynthesis
VPEKRIDLALAALSEVVAKVEGVMLVIVGDGSQRGAIAQEIERRHLQQSAKITGFLEDKNIIYSAFDVLLLPSDSEAFGLVATEAQSFGVPTISTNNGGIDEVIIHGENGLLVPLGETDPLAKAMIAMATDRLLYRRCARGALSSAMGRATWPAVAAVYLDLYLGLGRAHRPPRGDAG